MRYDTAPFGAETLVALLVGDAKTVQCLVRLGPIFLGFLDRILSWTSFRVIIFAGWFCLAMEKAQYEHWNGTSATATFHYLLHSCCQ